MVLLQLGQIDVLGNNGHDGTMTDGRPLKPRALSGKEHEFQVCLPLSTKASVVSIFLLFLSLSFLKHMPQSSRSGVGKLFLGSARQ